MNNWIAIGISLVYIFLVLGIASVVAKVQKGSTELSRKLVHILVGNWVFITPFFSSFWAVILVPATFVLLNTISLKYKIFSAMERQDKSIGTVYYAVSMLVLTGSGFLLGWQELPFIGLLSMAYGDGFAALTGQKWGKKKPFLFAPKKSLVGSATVAAFTFMAAFFSLLLLDSHEISQPIGFRLIIIPLLTSLFAALIELVGNKGCDNLSLPIGSGLFASLLLRFGSISLMLYLGIAVLILLGAYCLRSITADGAVAAVLTALTLYSLGGVWMGISLLGFFLLGSFVTKIRNENKQKAEARQELSSARNWKQVLANSLPACILLWTSQLFPGTDIWVLLGFSVFSAAAADTFSSELGMLGKGKVYHILSGKQIPSGVSGGVSWLGFGAGLLGSLLLSLPAVVQYGFQGYIFVMILGLAGTVVDSVLGATLQRRYLDNDGQLRDTPFYPHQKPSNGVAWMDNHIVNLLSLSLAVCIGLLFTNVFPEIISF